MKPHALDACHCTMVSVAISRAHRSMPTIRRSTAASPRVPRPQVAALPVGYSVDNSLAATLSDNSASTLAIARLNR
jgi:hypothetical protein